jgi:O-antigen ligase
VFNTTHSSEFIIKHVSLCLVMALTRVLRLPVTSRSKVRWMLLLQIVVVLAICLTVEQGSDWDGGTRRGGIFANPNNLALIPFLLLFLVDDFRDPLLIRLGVQAIVVTVLAASFTSGAVIAYGIGMVVHIRKRLSHAWRVHVLTAAAIGVAVAGMLFILGAGGALQSESRLTKQIGVITDELDTVVRGEQVAYFDQERELGPGAASGIWRLVHWRQTITTYWDGTLAQQLFGFGLGSSPAILGKLPHNEYLRALFEQGFIGLMLFLFTWGRVILTAPPAVRYVGLIVAIYSFSENNLDNFPFMSLLLLCLAAVEVPERTQQSSRRDSYQSLPAHGV